MFVCPIEACFNEEQELPRMQAHVAYAHRRATDGPDSDWSASNWDRILWRPASDEELKVAKVVLGSKRKAKRLLASESSKAQAVTEESDANSEIGDEVVVRKPTRPTKISGPKVKQPGKLDKKCPEASAASSAVPPLTLAKPPPAVYLDLTARPFHEIQQLFRASEKRSEMAQVARCSVSDSEARRSITAENRPGCSRSLSAEGMRDQRKDVGFGTQGSSSSLPGVSMAAKITGPLIRSVEARESGPALGPSSAVPLSFSPQDVNDMVVFIKTQCARPYVMGQLVPILSQLFPRHNLNELKRLLQMCILSLKMALELSHNELAVIQCGQYGPVGPGTGAIPFSAGISQDIFHSYEIEHAPLPPKN